MTPDFAAAAERARLAACDLAAAANGLIAQHSIRWRDARDEVDFTYLSRWTRYFPERKLDDAREDLAVATRTQTEVRSIAASVATEGQVGGKDGSTSEAQLVRRLDGLANECERRAIYLRSR
jgi:hypothetical protein